MKNLLRFLVFLVLALCAVGVVYLWKSGSTPAPLPASQSSRLQEMDHEFTDLVGSVLPSVVSISALPPDSLNVRDALIRQLLGNPPGAWPQSQLGSGALVSSDGYIVTNWHVIQNAGSVNVDLHDGRTLPAQLVGADRLADVAVLKIDATDLQPLAFSDSDDVRIGQMVVAVGNPLGLQESVTRGIISGKGRRMMSEAANEFFQTDAPINPGNSGGPLVDLNGRIVGLNNFVVQNTDGIGFAIPSNIVRRIYSDIRQYGRVIRPWFGVLMRELTPDIASSLGLPDSRGALIQATLDGSPAALAGLRSRDVILSYNGRQIADWKDLRNRVAETEPGREVKLDILRDGKKIPITVKISRQPGE